MLSDATCAWVSERMRTSIVPALVEYIRIPCKSPEFDRDWAANGHIARAVELLAAWARDAMPGEATLEVIALEGRTPVILVEVPGTSREGDTVLLYGHLDKQPEMSGWREGLGPFTPALEGDRLYGRGGADDGYALFASLTALAALRRDGLPHARCVVLIEACEESGSFDLPAYIEHLAPRIGAPSLVVCLDSSTGNWDQMWLTTSLRGVVSGTLEVALLREGVHSGVASGVVASSFRVLRILLDRLEDASTGEVLLPELRPEIPAARVAQAARAADVLGMRTFTNLPHLPGVSPTSDDPAALILARTYRPMLAITGADGLPPTASAGNVLRPSTAVKISMRLPPSVDAFDALARIEALLTRDPPYGARVTFSHGSASPGWESPPIAPWLEGAIDAASLRRFGRPAVLTGEGGSIPFMAMLGARFPDAQFMITGVLGPGSNAHGPNEFLHLPMMERLTLCVADVVAAHAART